MSVLDREALEASPLADLHTIASELSIDGYRRLRKANLIDAVIARQSGVETDGPVAEDAAGEDTDAAGRRRRGRRGGRSRSGAREGGDAADSAESETEPDPAPKAPARSARSSRAAAAKETVEEEPTVVEGVVELLANGSGFVRVSPPDPSDEDVYISAAQVKRCELVSGDTIAGPRRAPQRSERFASLVRVDTINGQSAAEVAERARYDELPASFPSERFRFASEDVTLKAIEFLTPIGRGSRVVLCGGAWAGKSHTLAQIAGLLAAEENLTLFVALVGVRPEELADWTAEGSALPVPAAALSFAASADAQDHAVELVIEQAKRIATRGGDAVVLIDSLEGLHPHAARKALAAARNLSAAGSLTVIATAARPLGGETTVITLDPALASINRFPALDLASSGTLRAELLVGPAGAAAIADARAEAFAA